MATAHDEPNPLSLSFGEELYAAFLHDPAAVPPAWRAYFARLAETPAGQAAAPAAAAPRPLSPEMAAVSAVLGAREAELAARQNRVDQLIRNHRVRGHIIAKVNPLADPPPAPPELDPAYYGFGEIDLDLPFAAGSLAPGGMMPLREILARLRNTYCRSIGAQFMHIDDLAVREWLQRRMEGCENRLALTRGEQLRILTRLTDAVVFEEFVQKKYVGAKSFSLEGAESLIPLLDLAIEAAGEQGVEEIVLAMAHRGRLNVLANIMGKSARLIFEEFEDRSPARYLGGGDVKYHLGYHADWLTATGRSLHLALCFNPSHLEYVNPVALGRVRAKQDRLDDRECRRSLVLLVHGEAAFAGEGIVQETLNLSELPGYRTGGSLHVVVNNQIGFTTLPAEGRSSVYATDVAKMLQIPIFHVNGEDPEAVAQVVRLALEYRREFQRDVVIDMYCYRRRGHNESDEPAFTQPLLYHDIRRRRPVRERYLEHMLQLGGVTREAADELASSRRELLEEALSAAREDNGGRANLRPDRPSVLGRIWQDYRGGADADVPEVETGVPRARLSSLLSSQGETPPGFRPHPKLTRLLELRRRMARGEKPLDWAAAEALAFASLLAEGTPVRLTGQDSERGTFSHRHAVLHDFETGERYVPLAHAAPAQASFAVYNSPLSEAGVLGFEYGYSLAYPEALVMWEAQFGDFANAAQVIIDQFLSSAEDKWRSLSGLVLLLPHGFEGQGPEHSSARLERFLTLAGQDNLQVAQPTTPAQFFHLLRRQVRRPWRKPLVVLTPKSMLRHPQAVSSLDELTEGGFRRILPDRPPAGGGERAAAAAQVLLCSGKIYYDLAEERQRRGRDDVAILRLEQLYPLAAAEVEAAMARYRKGTPARWVQDEPANMGAWPHLRVRFGERLPGGAPFSVVARAESASPATGSTGSHRQEHQELLERAFAPRGVD